MDAAQTTTQDHPPAPTLERARLLDVEGAEVRVETLHAQAPAVLVFVRHFGCLFCKQQVGELAARREDFQNRGAKLVVIGNGTVEQARGFAERYAQGMTVLTDPTREAFCAAGMKRGVATAVSFGVIKRAVQAVAHGYLQTSVLGDALQQGGVLVLDRDGRELYRFVSDEAGQHPPLDDVLAALPAPVR